MHLVQGQGRKRIRANSLAQSYGGHLVQCLGMGLQEGNSLHINIAREITGPLAHTGLADIFIIELFKQFHYSSYACAVTSSSRIDQREK